MKVIVIGASGGIGQAFVRALDQRGDTVIALSRGSVPPLDLTSDKHIADAAAEVADRGPFDRILCATGLLHGAGVAPEKALRDIDGAAIDRLFRVNATGPAVVMRHFLPLLRRSADPSIVNVSSGLGSTRLTHDPSRVESTVVAPAYTSSKAALVMLTTQYAKALADVRVNVVDPGYTATDLNHNSGHQTVEEGTDAIVRLATIGKDGPTGTFQDRAGTVPW